jgi:long-chain fatty acid transport protein
VTRFPLPAFLVAMATLSVSTMAMAQPGVYLPGGGAVHGGMAGVSTAAPLDAIGAVYWNPAAVGRLHRNEVSIGGAFVYPDISLFSSVPRLNGTVASGRTRSDNGFPLVPNIAVVSQLEEGSPWTMGFGLLALGGGGVNFPGDANNPLLAPSGPLNQFVLGPTYSNMQFLQLSPNVSYQLTDRLVVGAGPTVDIAMATLDPAYFAAPNQIPGMPNTFPSATNSRPFWGGGFKAGLVYSLTDTLDFGFGYTSKQWFETWEFNSRDNLGNTRRLALDVSLPAIYSWGLAWRGIECLTLAVDFRYFDYENTKLFGTPTRDGGLGWQNAFAVGFGANYQLTERLAVRAGYLYNTNPLDNARALFNIQSPAIIQNTFTTGTTYQLTNAMAMSLGYAYGMKNTISGQLENAPNARMEIDASSHSLLFNVQIRFGGQ